jgi:hypothetical protein
MGRGENNAFGSLAKRYMNRGFTVKVYPYRLGKGYQYPGRKGSPVFIGNGY